MIAIATLAALAILAVTLGLVRRHWIVVTVVGRSMEPTLHDGQRVVARRLGGMRRIARGDVIVFRIADADPGDVALRIKRVAAVAGDTLPVWLGPYPMRYVPAGKLVVSGDNAFAQSSRELGLVDELDVIAQRRAQPFSHQMPPPGPLTQSKRRR